MCNNNHNSSCYTPAFDFLNDRIVYAVIVTRYASPPCYAIRLFGLSAAAIYVQRSFYADAISAIVRQKKTFVPHDSIENDNRTKWPNGLRTLRAELVRKTFRAFCFWRTIKKRLSETSLEKKKVINLVYSQYTIS